MASTNQPVPALRRVAAVLVGLQALTVTINVLLIVSGLFGEDVDVAVGLSVAVLALLLAAALGLACRDFWVGKTWPRGLVITWQVLVAVVMISNLVYAWSLWSLANLVVAVACGVAVILDIRQEKSPALSDPAS